MSWLFIVMKRVVFSKGENEMDCRSLLSPSIRRRLLLIEILHERKEGVSTTELLQQLSCTLPILLNDIRTINDHQTIVSVRKNEGLYQLEKGEDIGLSHIYAGVIQNAAEFQVLEALLYEEHQTLADMAKGLYLSVPNTQRIVEKIRRTLRPVHIFLKHRPLRLEGNEAMVRHLFYRYFTEKNYQVTVELPQISPAYQEIISKYINSFIEKNDFAKVYVLYQRMMYNFFISAWRLKNGHPMPAELLTSEALRLPGEGVADNCGFLIKDRFGFTFDENVAKDLLWLNYSNALIFSTRHRIQALAESENYRRCFRKYELLVDRYMDLFPIPWNRQTRWELVGVLQNASYLYPMHSDHLDILFRGKLRFVRDLWQKHPVVVDRLYRLVTEFYREEGEEWGEDFIQAILYWLITTVPNSLALLEQQEVGLRILLVSVCSPTEEKFLANQIRDKVIGNFTLHQLENYQTQLHKEVRKYDLVISTGTVTIKDSETPLLNIDAFLSWQDVDRIQQKVNQLRDQKTANAAVPEPPKILSLK